MESITNTMNKVREYATRYETSAWGKKAQALDPVIEVAPTTQVATLFLLTLEEVRALHIKSAIARCNGNESEAAIQLGVSRRCLFYQRVEKYRRKSAKEGKES